MAGVLSHPTGQACHSGIPGPERPPSRPDAPTTQQLWKPLASFNAAFLSWRELAPMAFNKECQVVPAARAAQGRQTADTQKTALQSVERDSNFYRS